MLDRSRTTPPHAEEVAGQEHVPRQHDKVDKEAGRGLDQTDLAVGHGDQPLVHQLVSERVSGLALHDVGALGSLVGPRRGRAHVSS